MTSEYLEHHGILGQRWGVRRFQNPDGSLTKAGQKRYGTEGSRTAKQTQNRLNDVQKAIAYNKRDLRNLEETISTFKNKKGSNDFQKKVIKDKEEIKKRIEAGDKEIDNIIKKSGDYKITSKDIKQNTTPGAVRTYQTLAIVGSVPLSIVPGPNMALIGAVGYKVATNNANKVDSKKYKVENYEIPKKAPKDPNERRKIIEEATKRANGGKPYNSMSEYADAYRKIGKEINNRWDSGGKQKLTKEQKNAEKKIKALERSRELFSERAKPKPGNVSLIYDETMEEFEKELNKYRKILNS